MGLFGFGKKKIPKEHDIPIVTTGQQKNPTPTVVTIDNSSPNDNIVINECAFKVSVYCDEAYGSFSVDLAPGQSRKITYDVTANAYPYDRGGYDDLKYEIGRGEKWAVRKENSNVVMVKILPTNHGE